MGEGVCAGIDWAKDTHDVLVAGAAGERLWAARVTHDEAGLTRLCQSLVALGVERVAVERPDGLLIDRLLDAGIVVLAINPSQVAAARARFRPAGGKSDRFDAFVLCELARTDHHRFQTLVPDSDATKALRALTRSRQLLVQQRVALCSQLRAELERFWPGPIELFTQLDSPISLAFLQRYPAPADASRLGAKRMQQFLERHDYSGRRTAASVLTQLRAAPTGRAGEREIAARRMTVLALVAALSTLASEIRRLSLAISHAVRQHPDGHIFLSLFKHRDSVICAATLLAEIGDCRERYPPPSTSPPTLA